VAEDLVSKCPDCGAPNVPVDGYETHCGRRLSVTYTSMDLGWRESMLRNQTCKEVGAKRMAALVAADDEDR
jgi:hypothetical protein